MVSEHGWENTLVQCTCNICEELSCRAIFRWNKYVFAQSAFSISMCKNNNTRFLRANPSKLLRQIHHHAFSHATWSCSSVTGQTHALVCEILFDLSRLVTWRSPSCQNQNIPFWSTSDHPNPNLSTPVSFSGEFSDFSNHGRGFQQSFRKDIDHWNSAELLELSSLFSDYLQVTFWPTSVSQQLFSNFLLSCILWLSA